MEEIGQAAQPLVAAPRSATLTAFTLAALALSALACAAAWPFAIDDAWTSVRYARHLASGAGYVWNVGGPRTDGVTPLPWAVMLAPLAHGAPLVVLTRAKALGAAVWCLTAAAWGWTVGGARAPWWAKGGALLVLAVDLPVAAHAVSGMETPFATALATSAALSYRKPWCAALLAGLAATLRPELVVWAVVLACGLMALRGAATREAPRPSRVLGGGALAAAPFALCAAVRAVVFGHLAPLAVAAKPSDLAHGLPYAGAAATFALAPLLVVAPVALARERGPALAFTLAALAHLGAVVAVGGDWMPYARLVVPIVPATLLAFVLVAPFAHVVAHASRLAVALAVAAWLVPGNLAALRRAGLGRSAMIQAARPLLAGGPRVAAVDIGWVSVLSEGTIIDLAGVTDPEVAALPGGHTSKRVDPAFLLARSPDLLVFYADPFPRALADVGPDDFPRVVEARLAGAEAITERFAPAALLPLEGGTGGYVVYKRR